MSWEKDGEIAQKLGQYDSKCTNGGQQNLGKRVVQ